MANYRTTTGTSSQRMNLDACPVLYVYNDGVPTEEDANPPENWRIHASGPVGDFALDEAFADRAAAVAALDALQDELNAV